MEIKKIIKIAHTIESSDGMAKLLTSDGPAKITVTDEKDEFSIVIPVSSGDKAIYAFSQKVAQAAYELRTELVRDLTSQVRGT